MNEVNWEAIGDLVKQYFKTYAEAIHPDNYSPTKELVDEIRAEINLNGRWEKTEEWRSVHGLITKLKRSRYKMKIGTT